MPRCRALGRKQAGKNPICETARDFLAGLIVFITVFALAALDTGPAHPQTAAASAALSAHADQPPTPRPERMRSGALLIRPPDGGAARPYSEATRLGADISITVDGPVARATLTQTFRNDGERTAEGIYVFPLPGDAAVDGLSMQAGDRTVTGEILPRDKVREMYARAEQAARGPEPEDAPGANVFTSTVTKIAPGETVRVRIDYQQTLRRSEGGYTLRFPLAATPRAARMPAPLGVRYAVPEQDGNGESRAAAHARRDSREGQASVSLRVKLHAGFPLGAIESASHPVEIKRLGDGGALLTLREDRVSANGDFVLSWKPRETREPVAQLFRQTAGGSQYLLATITPPGPEEALARRPREVVFVVDTSGSMAGSAIAQTRDALKAAVARLQPDDRFNIIAFDTAYEALFKSPVPADENGKAIATQFIDRLVASGATDLMRPLGAALRDERSDDTTRVRQVVLITDGTIANGQKLFSEIAVRRGRSRLFLAGIGPAPQEGMLRRAAEVGRGGYIRIASPRNIREDMDGFLKRLERPALTDIEIEWPDGVRAEALPDPLPDLYAGQALVVSARADSALKGAARITGTFQGKPWSSELAPGAARKGNGVARLWARRKIASLESHAYYAREDSGKLDAKIEKVALEHQIVSRMTRLVAIGKPAADAGEPSGDGAAPPPGQPHGRVHGGAAELAPEPIENWPRAARAHAAGHERRVSRLMPAPATEQTPRIALPTAQDADRPGKGNAALQSEDKPLRMAQAGRNPLTPPLPQAEDAAPAFTERMGVIAIMALVFAAMSALTLGLWRQFGRLHAAGTEDKGRGT